MSEPDLFTLAGTPDYKTMFWGRLYYDLTSQDVEWDAWYDWAMASGDADQQWFASMYSGYVFQFRYLNTDALVVSTVPTLWNGADEQNGWCIRDERVATLHGGYCLFPVQTTPDGTAAETIIMADADFTTLEGMWASSGATEDANTPNQGVLYYTDMVTNGSTGTKVVENLAADPRQYTGVTGFKCLAVAAADGDGNVYQDCFKYQLKDDETVWSEGYPRFEKGGRVKTYLIAAVAGLSTYGLMQGEVILGGSEMLAAGLAMAATAALSF